MPGLTYKEAGVDIEAGNRAVELMKEAVRSTYGPEVLWGIGSFGGLYSAARLKEYKHPVLVASTDGVGTKTEVACAMGRFDTIGVDIVNHCINDCLVQGAEPLFFLDYVASARLHPESVAEIVRGAACACREAGCALLGGETAEMPGIYHQGSYDLVGTLVGVVERDEIIDGTRVAPGDVLIGLASSGLHTNGFSLVRKLFGPEDYLRHRPELRRTLGEELLTPHRSYLEVIRRLRKEIDIKGLAHITGGGFLDNIPRILPEGLAVEIELDSWAVPPIFRLIQKAGRVEEGEMYHVFNMGIGMVVVLAEGEAKRALDAAADEAYLMGKVVEWRGGAKVVLS